MVDRPKKRQGITSEILQHGDRNGWGASGRGGHSWGNKPSSCSGLQVGLAQVTGMRPLFVPGVALVSLEQHQPGGRRSSRHISIPCAPPAPVVVRMVYSRRF